MMKNKKKKNNKRNKLIIYILFKKINKFKKKKNYKINVDELLTINKKVQILTDLSMGINEQQHI